MNHVTKTLLLVKESAEQLQCDAEYYHATFLSDLKKSLKTPVFKLTAQIKMKDNY